MSKTTVTLFIILLLFIGVFLFIVFGNKQNSIISSLTKPLVDVSTPANITLSFTTDGQEVQAGQTITVAVQIHNPNTHPAIAQLEIAYDPAIITVEYLTPGTFFTHPTIALQNIDPVSGRISYALRCPGTQLDQTSDCVNTKSSTVAAITLRINPYALTPTTSLSFLPKTVVRIRTGKDLLQKTSNLQLTIAKALTPLASSSATASSGAHIINIPPVSK